MVLVGFSACLRLGAGRAKSLDMPSDSEESDSESEEDYYMSSGDEDDVGGLDLEAMLFDETGRVTFQGQEWMGLCRSLWELVFLGSAFMSYFMAWLTRRLIDRILGLHKDVGVRDMAEEEQQDDDVDVS